MLHQTELSIKTKPYKQLTQIDGSHFAATKWAISSGLRVMAVIAVMVVMAKGQATANLQSYSA